MAGHNSSVWPNRIFIWQHNSDTFTSALSTGQSLGDVWKQTVIWVSRSLWSCGIILWIAAFMYGNLLKFKIARIIQTETAQWVHGKQYAGWFVKFEAGQETSIKVIGHSYGFGLSSIRLYLLWTWKELWCRTFLEWLHGVLNEQVNLWADKCMTFKDWLAWD